MTGIRFVEINDFRCLNHARVEADPDCNHIIGPNASGKTSLLEALFLLGRGRSFRTNTLQTAIAHRAKSFTITGSVAGPAGNTQLGIRGERGKLTARVGGEPADGLAALARELPIQIIDASVHELVDGGPSVRRRFMDWGLFHVKPAFLENWRRYRRALKQRNAALKQGGPASVASAWDGELIATGEVLDEQRRAYLSSLEAPIGTMVTALSGVELALGYSSGWRADTSLADAIRGSVDRDRAFGLTHVGPHRADLTLRIDGAPARERASRGQQKLLAASLLLAQAEKLSEDSARRVVLLIDDPAAELDAERLALFLQRVDASPAQRFLTGLSRSALDASPAGKTFHVKQGEVEEML